MKMKISELLDNPNKWCQGTYARDAKGQPSDTLSHTTVSWCIIGAMDRCEYTTDETRDLEHKLIKIMNVGIVSYQDAPERTFAEVHNLLVNLGH